MRDHARRYALAGAVAAAIALAGCSGDPRPADPESPPPTGTNRPDQRDPSPAATATETEGPMQPAPAIAAYGTTWIYPDGLAVSVSEPEPFNPSEYAALPAEGGPDEYVTVGVTIVNGTGEVFDPSMAAVFAQSGNTEAVQVFDEGVNTAPSTAVLPEREVTWDVAFAVTDPSDVVTQVIPGTEYPPVIIAP